MQGHQDRGLGESLGGKLKESGQEMGILTERRFIKWEVKDHKGQVSKRKVRPESGAI